MNSHQPAIGEWYRMRGGDLFEVVAFDEADGTIEIQYFDGTVEEMELDDWNADFSSGALENAEAPEDWTGSVDVDPDQENTASMDDERRLNAGKLEGLDLFE